MSKEVIFYGERGILSSLILDTQGDIAKQKQFLRTIVLADKGKLDWVDDVYMIRYLVEPSFEKFGKPDLIIEAKTSKNEKYVLFIELRLNYYEYDALVMEPLEHMNNEYFPKSYKNVSHKINVQLAILYRFIQACKENLSEDGNITIGELREEDDVRQMYNDDVERRLDNRIMINYWYERFQYAKEYYFIALTNDSNEILKKKNLKSDLFPFNNKSIIPPIGESQWEMDKNKFGITTYETLINKKVISKNEGYYEDTSELMDFSHPTLSAYKKEKDLYTLVRFNTDTYSENERILYDFLKDVNVSDGDFKDFLKEFVKSIESK